MDRAGTPVTDPSDTRYRCLVEHQIPTATVARLSRYLTSLEVTTTSSVSSDELAARSGGNSAQVRKDLSFLGPTGTRGVGYSTVELRDEIRRALGLEAVRPVVIIGAGNLGSALAGYPGFARRGFRICGLFDLAPNRVGSTVAGITVSDMTRLIDAVQEPETAIGVIAVPTEAAQSVADLLVQAGFRSILNFAPTFLVVPPSVEVRQVDLASELHILSHHLARRPG